MDGLIPRYPLFHDTDNGNEGPDIYDAMSRVDGIYVDVPGLGLVRVSLEAAMDACRKLNDDTGANCFALQKISKSRGLWEGARILIRWM